MAGHRQRDQCDKDHADNHPRDGSPRSGIVCDDLLAFLLVFSLRIVRVLWVRAL
jgi:hypothetical protein